MTYYRVLFHARHRHLEQNTIGCLSKAVQPRNLSVSWQTGQGAARCLSSRRQIRNKHKSSTRNKKRLLLCPRVKEICWRADYGTGGDVNPDPNEPNLQISLDLRIITRKIISGQMYLFLFFYLFAVKVTVCLSFVVWVYFWRWKVLFVTTQFCFDWIFNDR